MRRLAFIGVGLIIGIAVVLTLLRREPTPAPEPIPAPPYPDAELYEGQIRLNDELTRVRWSDGDSFHILDGAHAESNVRLKGFNALEAYGPVHRWGTWTAAGLSEIAANTKQIGADETWECRTELSRDKYERLLVSCPEVGKRLVRQGRAHVFAIDSDPDPALVAAQLAGQKERLGMWAKGVPAVIITSLHSVAEGRGYDRFADTATGKSSIREHQDTYAVCQEVCMGPEGRQSCLTYVPFEMRYQNKPSCLLDDAEPGSEL